MTIKENMLFLKQLEEANIKSIESYLKRGRDDSITAIIRRENAVNTTLKSIVKDMIIDQESEVKNP